MLENQNMELVLLKDLGRLKPTESSNYKKRFGLYRCYCGNEFKTQFSQVKNGTTQSCGCYNRKRIREAKTTHGVSNSKLMPIWGAIVQRCTNINDKAYVNYGGRGITICEEWRNDFKSFYDWCIENGYEDGLSIDRIDNNKGYSKYNCRFVQRTTQARNTRMIISTNTSGYRGVCFHKRRNKFQSQITINSKIIYLGLFENAIDGAKAYDRYVIDNNLEHTRNGVL